MPGPSDAQKSVEGFQRLLERGNRQASAQVIRAYAPVYQRLQKDTASLVKVAQTRGLKPWQVMRMDRMKDLERQFLASAAMFADDARDVISDSQRAAVGLARTGAVQTVAAGLPPGVQMDNLARLGLGWNALPEDAFTNFVGIAADGNPIGSLLTPLGKEAADGVKDAIGSGIALGKGPRATAQLVRVAAGMPLSRALLITRTETNRAFREATRLQYANNSQVVKGYRRICAQNENTCIACIALDGTLYALDEPLNEHPNGRCALVPDVLDYADLGLDVERLPEPPNARDWLARQPEVRQRKMLGRARFDAWKKGDIQLNQLATVRPNPVWGDSAVIKPLNELMVAPPPPKPIQLPKTAATRPARRAQPKPPPEVSGNLVDPMTGARVRGTKTAPPEPQLPKEWDVKKFGDPDDFLDIAPVDASPDIIKYRGATGREAIVAQVKEQEAWTRATGGSLRVDYDGLSIRAAREVNQALEATIVRNGWRPLDVINTKRLPQKGGEFGRAFAYQYGNGVHINTQSSGVLGMRQGSVRGWDKKILADNEFVAKEYKDYTTQLAKMQKELASKAEMVKAGADRAESSLVRSLEFHNRPEKVAARGGRELTELDWLKQVGYATKKDFLEAQSKQYAKELEQSIKLVTKEAAKKRSQVFHPTQGTETLKEIITHEVGHYAHGRWGMNYRNEVLKGKKGKDHARNLSEYALDSPEEHFAEAFAKATWGNRSELGADVLKLVDEVMEANTLMPDVAFSLGARYDKAKRGLP
jgi:hypothetical protein